MNKASLSHTDGAVDGVGDIKKASLECNKDVVKSVTDRSYASLSLPTVYVPDPDSVLRENVLVGIEMPYPTVPVISVGKRVRCSVSHVHDSDVFYVKRHVGMDDDVDDCRSLLDESFEWKMAMMGVQSTDKKPVRVEEVEDMMPCLCLYENDQRWHRAVVLSKMTLPFVLVQYVDFGTLEEVSVERLRHISDALIHLPVQAFMCSLANQPAFSAAGQNSFLEQFGTIVQGRYLEVEVHAVEKPISYFAHYLYLHIVSLYGESGAKIEFATFEL